MFLTQGGPGMGSGSRTKEGATPNAPKPLDQESHSHLTCNGAMENSKGQLAYCPVNRSLRRQG